MSPDQPEVTECGYHEDSRACHEPPVIVARMGGKQVGLCQRHKR